MSSSILFEPQKYTILPESIQNLSPTSQTHFKTFSSGPLITPSHKLIHHAFETHATTNPTLPAIIQPHQTHHNNSTNHTTITYKSLNHHSNNLSNLLLHKYGIQPGHNIGLFLERSIEMCVSILSILKVGAAYVPQQVGVVPEQQLKNVVHMADIHVILTTRSCLDSMNWCKHMDNVHVVVVDDVMKDLEQEMENQNDEEGEHGKWMVLKKKISNVNVEGITTDSCCFIIFTSGTTGQPKGVQVSHKNVTNILLTSPGNLNIMPGTRVGHILSISFDMGTWEMLGCLCNGGTLVMRNSGKRNGSKFSFQTVAEQVHVLISTPTILSMIDLERVKKVGMMRTVAVAGEPCPKPLADKWGMFVDFWNMCGPTETTIVNTGKLYKPGKEGELLTIGKPTPNNLVYVLNEDLKPLEIGEVGEMWAGGMGVTKGYIGKDELTRERYRPDVFIGGGYMMYRTGDLGRWTAHGELEHLGRCDDQVKIKGFRVELDGISAVMEKTPGIRQAVALKIDNDLVAFVTPASANVEDCKEMVAKQLPYYCIPKTVFCMDTFPNTKNGKVAKKELKAVAKEAFALQISNSPLRNSRDTKANMANGKSTRTSLKDLLAAEKETTNSNTTESVDIESQTTDSSEWYDEMVKLPAKKGSRVRRFGKYVAFSHHRRFIALVTLINLIVFLFGFIRNEWWMNLDILATIVFANITAAILFRQQRFINLFFRMATLVPTSWSLSLRWSMGKVYHFGGLHSGTAISGTVWFIVFLASAIWQLARGMPGISVATVVLTGLLVLLLVLVIVCALPFARMKFHNNFEMTHRFGGWSVLAMAWIVTFVFVNDQRHLSSPAQSYGTTLVSTAGFWLLIISTISILLPWLDLQRVPVDVQVPSSHAAIVTFNHGVTPLIGSSSQISLRPLFEWHSFANIPSPGKPGFRLIISRAGDWTSNFIDTAPSHVWIKGIPTAGVANIETLFKKVLYVATGSGIGPVLPHLLAKRVPCNLIWTARTPRLTYGNELVDEILTAEPQAYIHDTKTLGKPNMVELSYKGCRYFQAEAVIVISNQKLTRKVVYGLESRGIPCFGAIWDS